MKVVADRRHRSDRQRARARAPRARRRGDRALARRRAGAADARPRGRGRRAGRTPSGTPPRQRPSPAATRWSISSAKRWRSAGATTPSGRSATRACSAPATWSRACAPPTRGPRCWCRSRPPATTAPAATSPWTSRSRRGATSWPGVTVGWEEQAQRAAELGLRVVTTRTGVVLAEDGGALEKMLPFFKAGVGGPVAGGRQYVPWVHIDDVVGRDALLPRPRRGRPAR